MTDLQTILAAEAARRRHADQAPAADQALVSSIIAAIHQRIAPLSRECETLKLKSGQAIFSDSRSPLLQPNGLMASTVDLRNGGHKNLFLKVSADVQSAERVRIDLLFGPDYTRRLGAFWDELQVWVVDAQSWSARDTGPVDEAINAFLTQLVSFVHNDNLVPFADAREEQAESRDRTSKKVTVFVLATNASGEPEILKLDLDTASIDVSDGDRYRIACERAIEAGYEGPVAFDSTDRAGQAITPSACFDITDMPSSDTSAPASRG